MTSARKDLCEVVIDALELFQKTALGTLSLGEPRRRLVVASGNALPTGRIIFEDEDAVFASEDDYKSVLARTEVDGAVVISASGKKHAPIIVGDLLERGLDTRLLTCDGASPAAQLLDDGRVFVTPSNEEPITYNTSTYLGMIFAKTKESPKSILDFIRAKVDPLIPDMSAFGAFYLIIEGRFNVEREMFVTKFDELFGPMMPGRCYTLEQTLHAKTVVESEKELFISFGYENGVFGRENARLNIPLPKDANHAAMIAVGYYVIGRLQSQLHPFFHESSDRYKALQPELFKKVLGK